MLFRSPWRAAPPQPEPGSELTGNTRRRPRDRAGHETAGLEVGRDPGRIREEAPRPPRRARDRIGVSGTCRLDLTHAAGATAWRARADGAKRWRTEDRENMRTAPPNDQIRQRPRPRVISPCRRSTPATTSRSPACAESVSAPSQATWADDRRADAGPCGGVGSCVPPRQAQRRAARPRIRLGRCLFRLRTCRRNELQLRPTPGPRPCSRARGCRRDPGPSPFLGRRRRPQHPRPARPSGSVRDIGRR